MRRRSAARTAVAFGGGPPPVDEAPQVCPAVHGANVRMCGLPLATEPARRADELPVIAAYPRTNPPA
jgi:hypothetical protein